MMQKKIVLILSLVCLSVSAGKWTEEDDRDFVYYTQIARPEDALKYAKASKNKEMKYLIFKYHGLDIDGVQNALVKEIGDRLNEVYTFDPEFSELIKKYENETGEKIELNSLISFWHNLKIRCFGKARTFSIGYKKIKISNNHDEKNNSIDALTDDDDCLNCQKGKECQSLTEERSFFTKALAVSLLTLTSRQKIAVVSCVVAVLTFVFRKNLKNIINGLRGVQVEQIQNEQQEVIPVEELEPVVEEAEVL